ncbi:hypothetical protein Y032_0036g3296 [Ancylostoma ceylanicum]|uniref:Uncharacterized protein n=1 Tax=Ancylostoma ceylanicum TaxID=53326 RepID=A0A016ULB1_9BILA|nr:hypothetical protein Y032_0036g3296 [Ancylostoma ceylanicum]
MYYVHTPHLFHVSSARDLRSARWLEKKIFIFLMATARTKIQVVQGSLIAGSIVVVTSLMFDFTTLRSWVPNNMQEHSNVQREGFNQ